VHDTAKTTKILVDGPTQMSNSETPRPGDVEQRGEESIRGIFNDVTKRKPLAFAADAVRYGI
jgi:hypothetical protein